MTEEKKELDWQYRKSGLYVPKGVPDGGKRVVGFARALEDEVENRTRSTKSTS